MGCSPPGPSVMGVFMQEYWNGLPFPTPEDLPEPGIEPMSPESPALPGRFFTTELPGCTLYNKPVTASKMPFWILSHSSKPLNQKRGSWDLLICRKSSRGQVAPASGTWSGGWRVELNTLTWGIWQLTPGSQCRAALNHWYPAGAAEPTGVGKHPEYTLSTLLSLLSAHKQLSWEGLWTALHSFSGKADTHHNPLAPWLFQRVSPPAHWCVPAAPAFRALSWGLPHSPWKYREPGGPAGLRRPSTRALESRHREHKRHREQTCVHRGKGQGGTNWESNAEMYITICKTDS